MFGKPSVEAVALDQVIIQLESEMQTIGGDSEDYPKMMNQLERLYKLKAQHASKPVDPNTLILVGGNLLGILVIVWHEQAHVITSKALSFAGKLR